MDGEMAMTQSEAPMKMTFEPVVAPGSLDDCFAELEYRISHGFEEDWMQDESMESMHFDAVVRVETRPQQPQLPPTQPQIPTFERNAQWLEILLKACAPPGAAKLPDGGAAIIAKIAAAARARGLTNPIDGMRAAIAERDRKELEAVAKAEEAQVEKRREAAARRVARRNELIAGALAAGKLLPPLPRQKAAAAAASNPAAAPVPQPPSAIHGVKASSKAVITGATAAHAGGSSLAVIAAAAVAHAPLAGAPQAQRPLVTPIAAPAGRSSQAAAHPAAAAAAAQPSLQPAQQQPGTPLNLRAASAAPTASPAAAPAGKGGSSAAGGNIRSGGSKRPAENAADKSAAGPPNAAAGASQDTEPDTGGEANASTRAKRQRQREAPRSTWTLQLSFCDDVTGQPIHFKADGTRFRTAKAPASLKFAFNRWYRVRLTVDDSLVIGQNAHLTSRSPVYFEHPTDQAAANPFFQDDAVKFEKLNPGAAAAPAAGVAAAAAPATTAGSGVAAAPAPAVPAPKKAKGAAKSGAPAASPPAAAGTPASPPPQEANPGRTIWEGRWRNLAEPTKKTQRAALWLGLRCDGLGPLELPLMAKIYEYTILYADLQDRAALQGQVLKHITFTVERNPFSELLEVSGATYTAAAAAKKP